MCMPGVYAWGVCLALLSQRPPNPKVREISYRFQKVSLSTSTVPRQAGVSVVQSCMKSAVSSQPSPVVQHPL